MLSEIMVGLKLLASPLTTWLQGRAQLKQAALDSKLRLNEAKTTAQEQRLSTGQAADIAWENTSIENSGWKDEWFTLLISTPAIMCFCGDAGAAWVTSGFAALAGCPPWYQWAFGIAFGSAFGVKEFTKFKNIMKGS